MVPRIVFAALFLVALASRPDASTGKRRAFVADQDTSASAPTVRAAPAPSR